MTYLSGDFWTTGNTENTGCTELERNNLLAQDPTQAQNQGPAFWEGYRVIIGNWLMRGRFPTVYPTGPSEEGSAESEPSFFLCVTLRFSAPLR